MANKLREMIEQMQNDPDRPDEMAGLLELLKKKQAELGEDITDEQADAAIQQCLMEHLTSALGVANDNIEMSEDDTAYMEAATSKVKELFDQEGWHYSERQARPDLTIFELGFGLGGCNLRMRVYIETNPKVCRVDAILPITADSIYDYVLCAKMAKENYPRRYGALQYDENDGEMSYRYSFPIGHGLYTDDLKHIFLAVASSASVSFDVIKKCCVGKFKSKEINEILKKVNDLVSDLSDEGE